MEIINERVFTKYEYECSNKCECFGGGAGGKSGINGEEGVCNRYYGVGFLISCPLKLLA